MRHLPFCQLLDVELFVTVQCLLGMYMLSWITLLVTVSFLTKSKKKHGSFDSVILGDIQSIHI